MNKEKKQIKSWVIWAIVVGLVVLDQVVKISVKTTMTLGESHNVLGNWFRWCFVENEGAAFGMSLGGDYGKLALSLFRIVAIGALVWFVHYLRKQKAPTGVVVGFALILAGALGNMIDSAFYGMIFSESTFASVATFLPEGGGYAPFLHGKVVDMLYFPLFHWPEWMPLIGGDLFFSPVFNFADSYITIAVFYLLIFHWRYFK
ncbi:MAG: lipoprotein signal peptidase [Rikenellaceae bacterium]|nr:lipoprotein signal peptidase [Rikenellaceae bacterium]